MYIFGSHTNKKKGRSESEFWELKTVIWGAENELEGGQRSVDNQSTLSSFHTHTSSKPMEFALVAVERGKRQREKKTLISFGSLRLHFTPSIKKGREA